MTENGISQPEQQPLIDFNHIIKVSRRQSTDVERQVTICRYRTFTGFDFGQILTALDRCRLTAADDFGVINVNSSKEYQVHGINAQNNGSTTGGNVEGEWVHAIFGIIGDKYFRWLDLESREIYEYMINGVLSETFMTEYYRNPQNELEFLTYGGTQHEVRIKAKHHTCFRLSLRTDMIEFDYDTVRQICLRSEFKLSLKKIGYLPLGEAGYGTVDRSLMQTKYANTIDTSAERVQEILANPKILIEEFSSRLTLSDPFVREPITIRFDFSKRGRVTLHLPKIDFYKPLSDVELERKFYEIVRNAYVYITKGDVRLFPCGGTVFQAHAQLPLFESTLDAFLTDTDGQDGNNISTTTEYTEEAFFNGSHIP